MVGVNKRWGGQLCPNLHFKRSRWLLPGKTTEEQGRKEGDHHIVQARDHAALTTEVAKEGGKQILDILEEVLTRLTDALEMEGSDRKN